MSPFILETEETIKNKQRILTWYQGQREERRQRQEYAKEHEGDDRSHHGQYSSYPPNLACQESSLLLLSGPSGSGKCHTAIESLANVVDKDGGYVILGKFDFLQHPKPYSALCSAFDDFAFSVLKRRYDREELEAVRQAIQETDNVVEMFPSLQRILDLETGVDEQPRNEHARRKDLGGSSATGQKQRFVEVFRKFLGHICQPNRPIVIVLQHLQWIDIGSIYALHGMATEAGMIDLFFVGTIDNDDTDELPFCDTATGNTDFLFSKLREIELKTHSSIVRMEVRNLDLPVIRKLLEMTLGIPEHSMYDDANESSCAALARVVHGYSNGNLFCCLRILDWLQETKLLYLCEDLTDNENHIHWKWDIEAVRLNFAKSNFLSDLLQRLLTAESLQLVKVAACFGPHIDESLLSYILSAEGSYDSFQEFLDEAITSGVFTQRQNLRLVFPHTSVQRAAYELIPANERELFHVEAGRRLWRRLHGVELDRNIYVLLSQFVRGKRLITRDKERVGIASLCLHAAQKGAKSSAFEIALVYLNLGMELLGNWGWKNEYDLTLALHNAGSEMELCSANFERMNELIDVVVEHARCEQDKVQALTTRMYVLGISNRYEESIDIGLRMLERFGEALPANPSKLRVLFEARRISRRMKSLSNEQLLRLPQMEKEDKLACVRILLIMSLHSMMTRPALSAIVKTKLMALTLDWGLSAVSSPCFASYGMFSLALSRNMDEGFRIGQLALTLLERYGSIEYLPRVYAAYYGVIWPSIHPISHSIKPLQKAYRVGLETGDFEFATICARTYTTFAVGSGVPLSHVIQEWKSIRDTMVKTRSESALALLSPMIQALHHIAGLSEDPLAGRGEIYDFDLGIEEAKDKKQYPRLRHIRFCRTLVSYVFGNYELANMYKTSRHSSFLMPPLFEYVWAEFWGGMVCVAMALQGNNKRKNIRRAKKVLQEIENRAVLSPYNFLGKEHLLRAEICSATGKLAEKSYICAIALARDSGVLFDHALSNERAAHHFHRIGDQSKAAHYFRTAVASYKEWGGDGKAAHLSAEVSQLLPACWDRKCSRSEDN